MAIPRATVAATTQRNPPLWKCREAELEEHTLDAVLTDPPYFANVQYAELMDFCYAWLRRIVDRRSRIRRGRARRRGDLTGNRTLDRGLEHFVEGLSDIYCRLARALKPAALVFTYHHDSLDAYYPVAVALLDAGLICTASLPCPAEMGGSIHIHGSDLSIVDTVFVCRATGVSPPCCSVATRIRSLHGLPKISSCSGTAGSSRPLVMHAASRSAIWCACGVGLRGDWSRTASWTAKLVQVAQEIGNMPGWQDIAERIESPLTGASLRGFRWRRSDGTRRTDRLLGAPSVTAIEDTVEHIVAAETWNQRVQEIRRVPEHHGQADHQSVYAEVADRLYKPHLTANSPSYPAKKTTAGALRGGVPSGRRFDGPLHERFAPHLARHPETREGFWSSALIGYTPGSCRLPRGARVWIGGRESVRHC